VPARSLDRHVARGGAHRPTHTARASHKPAPRAANPYRPVIVIDPGHGGEDPGAIGLSGTAEKSITLATALELRRVLEARGRYRVALTRTDDRTVSLQDRLAFARQRHADLFVAIHADSVGDRSTRGASVYIRGEQETSHIAVRPGNARRIASALPSSAPEPERSSVSLQHSIIEQLSEDVHMAGAPARAAHLYVLGSRTIPSVLLEMGFLSNRRDEALLRQPKHRHELVNDLKDAIDDYFSGIKRAGQRT
jgi:N-acetylmuramoyl-L-alanine amidase